MKQPNKLLKNDKDLWITLAAERNLTATVKTYQHILSYVVKWQCREMQLDEAVGG